jgi:tRNA-dihydrouridine synthase A
MAVTGPYEANTVVQLASYSSDTFIAAARTVHALGFSRINLNCGCPSDRVKSAHLGAILMTSPERIAEMMCRAQDVLPEVQFSIKCRIGVDQNDSYAWFRAFVDQVHQALPSLAFIVHARKAWLQGLSTKQNRTVPPLHYDYVYSLARERPHIALTLNGGLDSPEKVLDHLQHFPGALMLGRSLYHNPLFVRRLFSDLSTESQQDAFDAARIALIQRYAEYATEQVRLSRSQSMPFSLVRPLQALFHADPLASLYRRQLHTYFEPSRRPERAHLASLSFQQRIECVLAHLQRVKRRLLAHPIDPKEYEAQSMSF